MSDFLLEMNHITKIFPGTRALDDVSFNLKKGEIHAIVGENGATLEVPGFEGLTVEQSDDGALILYVNELNKFDDRTVDDWIDAL